MIFIYLHLPIGRGYVLWPKGRAESTFVELITTSDLLPFGFFGLNSGCGA